MLYTGCQCLNRYFWAAYWMSYPYVFSVLPPYQLYLMARFGAIPFSRYRIVQGTHLNSPPLHHPLTASRYRRSTATDLDREFLPETTTAIAGVSPVRDRAVPQTGRTIALVVYSAIAPHETRTPTVACKRYRRIAVCRLWVKFVRRSGDSQIVPAIAGSPSVPEA